MYYNMKFSVSHPRAMRQPEANITNGGTVPKELQGKQACMHMHTHTHMHAHTHACNHMHCDGLSDQSLMVDPLCCFMLQPVLNNK